VEQSREALRSPGFFFGLDAPIVPRETLLNGLPAVFHVKQHRPCILATLSLGTQKIL
jgi:hypothetical protein